MLSRAAALQADPRTAASAGSIATLFAQRAKRRMAETIRRITRNEDDALRAVAAFALEEGRYPWDVL